MTPREYVVALYRAVLRRAPDKDGLDHWIRVIELNGDYTAALAGIMASEEYKILNSTIDRRDPDAMTGGNRSIRFKDITALNDDCCFSTGSFDFDIIVPVTNAVGHLAMICDGYDALGVKPLFIVEARSTDRSLSILQDRDLRVFTALGEAPYVESLLAPILPYLGATWVLRMDDDELPSHEALEWIRRSLDAEAMSAVALPRRWIWRQEGSGWVFSRCETIGGPWGADHQIRLFRPRDVEPSVEIHTAGFLAPYSRAPEIAAFYHFDWIVHSYDQRQRKIERYESQESGKGHIYTRYYLPENETDLSVYAFETVTDQAIRHVCDDLARRPSSDDSERTEFIHEFLLLGVRLRIPDRLMDPAIAVALRNGYYEGLEVQMLERLLRPDDIVLEIGAAIGFLSTWAAQRLGEGKVLAFEANPLLIPVAKANYALNNVGVTLSNALVAAAPKAEHEPFFLQPAFWASSKYIEDGERVEVPTARFSTIMQADPTILIVDIEGGEVDLFAGADLRTLRHVIMEIHEKIIGPRGIRDIFAHLHDHGLCYSPDYSCGCVVTFSRA